LGKGGSIGDRGDSLVGESGHDVEKGFGGREIERLGCGCLARRRVVTEQDGITQNQAIDPGVVNGCLIPPTAKNESFVACALDNDFAEESVTVISPGLG